jgi:hypothetical protein
VSDLDKLIAAVEAGVIGNARDAVAAIEAALGHLDAYRDGVAMDVVGGAFYGSLDAAKRLHDALLPGWKWDVTLHAASVEEPNRRFNPNFPLEVLWSGSCDDPARAWLLAILRAVKAQG